MNANVADRFSDDDTRDLLNLWGHADLQRWRGIGVPAGEEIDALLAQWKAGHAIAWILRAGSGDAIAYIYAIEEDDPRFLGLHVGATKDARGVAMSKFAAACLGYMQKATESNYIITAEVDTANGHAIAMAKRFGFSEFYRDPETVVMRKELR